MLINSKVLDEYGTVYFEVLMSWPQKKILSTSIGAAWPQTLIFSKNTNIYMNIKMFHILIWLFGSLWVVIRGLLGVTCNRDP